MTIFSRIIYLVLISTILFFILSVKPTKPNDEFSSISCSISKNIPLNSYEQNSLETNPRVLDIEPDKCGQIKREIVLTISAKDIQHMERYTF